jgi:glucose/arabinose dehydrogenase
MEDDSVSRFLSLNLEPLEERLTPAVLPTGFSESVVASGLEQATTFELAPDGKVFLLEQAGTAEVFQNGNRVQADFFRDTPLTVDPQGERGLLGIAFDPNYASNRFVYVYYTATTPQVHNRVSRFTANPPGDLALAGSETVLLELNNLSAASNHNGGAIHFGPDGNLYVATGENATPANSQSLDNLLGKILRITADGSIPTDNPFFNQATGNNRAIWALGLRNPFTFAFQPGTGRMFINDVGQSTFEEINDGSPGANYGWPTTEGPTSDPRFQTPFFFYDHSRGCAITGGAFYNPTSPQFPPSFTGDYFYSDLCEGEIRLVDLTTRAETTFATDISFPVDLRVGEDGSLYYLSRGSGQLFQVTFNAPRTQPDTPGSFDPTSATWYLRNSASAGAPDIEPFAYGAPGWLPVTGDYNGDGVTTVGVIDPTTQTWYLRNSNTPGAPDVEPFSYGLPGWVPLVGDWDGNGAAGIGVFDPGTGIWYLRNASGPGAPDFTPFEFGLPGWVPVVGDWDGNGTQTVGIFDPTSATWYLRNSNTPGPPDLAFTYGGPGWTPVVGDWDGDGLTTVGVVDPAGVWYLRNANSPGAPNIPIFPYGAGSWTPLTGTWAPAGSLLGASEMGTAPDLTPLTDAELQAVLAVALERLEGREANRHDSASQEESAGQIDLLSVVSPDSRAR